MCPSGGPKCKYELSYILAELYNVCLKESYLPDCWKVSSVVSLFKNVCEKCMAKNDCLSVLKVHEKFVNNRLVHHLENCGLFSDFQYGFRSSQPTADLLTFVSDRIGRAFNSYGATPAVQEYPMWSSSRLHFGHTLFLLYINDLDD